MGWFWPILQEGGPWAAFLVLLGLVIWMRLTDRWMTEKAVDRAIAGYVETNKNLNLELAYQRQANKDKDQTIATQANQIARLLEHSALSTHAIQSIFEEAPK